MELASTGSVPIGSKPVSEVFWACCRIETCARRDLPTYEAGRHAPH